MGIDGTLFVYKRSEFPYYWFIIVSNLSTASLIKPLTRELEFQLQSPFLLYCERKDFIYGISFDDKVECFRIGNIMYRLAYQMPCATKQVKPVFQQQKCTAEYNWCKQSDHSQPRVQDKGGVKSRDIVSLLSAAQYEYDKKKINIENKGKQKVTEDEIKSTKGSQLNNCILVGKVKKVRHLKQTIVDSKELCSPSTTPLSVAMLFAHACHSQQICSEKQTSKVTLSKSNLRKPLGSKNDPVLIHTPEQSVECTGRVLNQLQSNSCDPKKLSCKQQKSKSRYLEETEQISTANSSFHSSPSTQSLEQELKKKLKLISEPCNMEEPSHKTLTEEQEIKQKVILKPGNSKELNIKTPSPVPFKSPILSPQPALFSNSTVSKFSTQRPIKSPAVSLLTPVMIEQATDHIFVPVEPSTFSSNKSDPPQNQFSETFTSMKTCAVSLPLLPPEAFINPSYTACRGSVTKEEDYLIDFPQDIVPLTRRQLKGALMYLLKHDQDFVNSLYEAYVLSLQINYKRSM
ncbi:uncharacterized protein LOC143228920 isoform X2 [Tachypleus tridentatus]